MISLLKAKGQFNEEGGMRSLVATTKAGLGIIGTGLAPGTGHRPDRLLS